MKERLDVLLVKKKLADSREKAKAIIMAGNVFVDGQREDKAGSTFPEDASIEIRGHVLPYVSRGGLKLEKALQNFNVDVSGRVCTDVGSSTGGFTGCLLQNGAADDHVEQTHLRFKPLSDAEIDAYIATGSPLDKAGAYGIQDQAAVFVEALEGDYYTVMGLPLCALVKCLRRRGVAVLGAVEP